MTITEKEVANEPDQSYNFRGMTIDKEIAHENKSLPNLWEYFEAYEATGDMNNATQSLYNQWCGTICCTPFDLCKVETWRVYEMESKELEGGGCVHVNLLNS